MPDDQAQVDLPDEAFWILAPCVIWSHAVAGAYQCDRCGALAIPGEKLVGNLTCPTCGGETFSR